MFKSKKYLRAVAEIPCVVTGRPAQVHHVIGHGFSGMALKAPDTEVIPLAPEIHDELHRYGYRRWEAKYGSQLVWSARIKSLMKAKGIYQDCFPDDISDNPDPQAEDDSVR